jgi:hypothetical protein
MTTPASTAAATDKDTRPKKDVEPAAETGDENDDAAEGGDKPSPVAAATDLSVNQVPTGGATTERGVVPTASISETGFTFGAVEPKPEKKEGFFSGLWRGAVDTVTGAAKAVGDGAKYVASLAKSAWDSAAGVIDSALDSVWDKEFGAGEVKSVKNDKGEYTEFTGTADGRTINSKKTENGYLTTVSDRWGNTTTFDGNAALMTDKNGGTYRIDAATGDAIFEGKDGQKIIQRKDGTKEFYRNGTKIEQAGDGTLKMENEKLQRFIRDNGIEDRVKAYHEKLIPMYSHGNQNRADVPAAERDKVGVHQFGDGTERVTEDGSRFRRDRFGNMWLSHKLESGELKIEQGADGKPIFKRKDGTEIKLSDMKPCMRRAFEALQNGSNEAVINGVPQVRLDAKGGLVVGDVTLGKPDAQGKITTEVQTGPAPTDKAVYTNDKDGVQTGPGMDGGERFIYDRRNKETPYTEVNAKGEVVSSYNPQTDTYKTPEFTSNRDVIEMADGNKIYRDGTISNADGSVRFNSSGYSSSHPEYISAGGKITEVIGTAGSAIGAAKVNPGAPGAQSLVEGAITNITEALARAIKTGNFEKLNQLFGLLSDAQGALVQVQYAQAAERQQTALNQQAILVENDRERQALSQQHRVA